MTGVVPLVLLAALGILLSACGGPSEIELAVYEADLIEVSESGVLGEGRVGPGTRHLVAHVDVPENAFVSLDGRLVRQGPPPEGEGPLPLLGPVAFSLQVDGREIFHRRVEGEKNFAKTEAEVELGRWAGQRVKLELRIQPEPGAGQVGAYWHRATLEHRAQAPRLAAGEGWNLLFVLVDTLRADHMSLHGHHRPTTPHLDAWAEEGLVFEHAFAPASWTLPSTVSLLTGLTPPAHGVVGGGHHLWPRHHSLAEILAARGLSTFAASANPLIGPGHGFDQGFETFEHAPWQRAGEINGLFLDWLDRFGSRNQWFAYLHYIDPHDPYDAPAPGDRFLEPGYDGVFTDPALLNRLYQTVNWQLEPPAEVTERDLDYLRDGYDGEILYWDEHFGQLLAELERRGLDERTLIVVTSDHGEEFREHGMYKHGHQLYDESLRVPLILHAPGLVDAGRRQDLVSNLGIFRAVQQLLRLGLPLEEGDLLKGPADGPPRIFAHTRVPVAPDQPRQRRTWATVRSAEESFIRAVDLDREWLFELGEDPGQLFDVSAEWPDRVGPLRSQLEIWLTSTPPPAVTPSVEADPESIEALRSLGYTQ